MAARPSWWQTAPARAAALLLAWLALSPTPVPLGLTDALRRAETAAAAQDFATAAEAYAEAARRLPYEARLVYQVALADLSAGRYEGALTRLRQVAAASGWTPALHVAMGDAYAGSGDQAAALAEWERAAQDLPDNDALLARLAAVYEANGRLSEAASALNRRLQNGNTEPAVLYRLALVTAASAPAAAIGRLTTVANLESEFAPYAWTLLQAVQEAESQQNPAYSFGRVGYQLIQFQEWALAEYALQQAVALSPEYADAHAYLGLAQDAQGRDGGAAFETALRLAPTSPLINYLVGLHYRSQGASAQAVPYLEAAFRLDPANPAIAAELGGAFAAQNDLPNAELWFTKAVELAPNEGRFWLLLARFHVDNEFKVAELGLPAARMAVGLAPDDALAADALGYALIVSGDLENGRQSLERALTLDPSLAQAYYHVGLLYAIQNQAPEAKAALNQALTLDPQGPVGKRALQALALLP